MAERPTERQRVEEYLKVHCIQECLDEVINDLIESRPSNPYIAITKMMETKTLGEITDIQINSTITGRGSSGIKATVHTNIGSFSAIAAYPYSSDAPYGLTRDFTVIEDILKDALCSLDPRNMSDIDGKLDMISTLGSTISIAVSMACCRAGARHKGLPLYRYLNSVGERDKNCDSKLGGLESQLGLAALRIPLPVVAMISRSKIEEGSSNGPGIVISQDVSIYPTGSNCVDQALDTVQHIHRILLNKIGTAGQGATGTVGGIGTGTGVLGDKEKEKEKSMIQVTPDCGCLRVSLPSVDEAVKFISTLISESSATGLKVGFDNRARSFTSCIDPTAVPISSSDPILYNFYGTAPIASASSQPVGLKTKKSALPLPVVTDNGPVDAETHLNRLSALFKETLFISIEDAVHRQDYNALVGFKMKLLEGLSDSDSPLVASGLTYAKNGVGGERGCSLQLVADADCLTPKDIINLTSSNSAINAIKIRLDKVNTVSQALDISRAARKADLAQIVGYSESGPESLDSFIADLSVAIGAGQLTAGGILSGEHFCKYTRLSEISREDPTIPFAGQKFRC